MENLKHDWLTEGLIDYEYKKYILLAYLKDIKHKFNATELFPFLSDLIFHYKNLERIKNSKTLMFESFPKSISKADFEKLELTYQELVEDDEVMREIEDIISFAIPRITDTIDEGKEIFEFVEENVEFSPIGLSSIYQNEGYLFIDKEMSKTVQIYRYQVTLFQSADEQFRGVSTTYVDKELKGFSNSYQNIKVSLLRRFRDLPNPATYLLTSKLKFPLESTLLPMAKRILIKNISVS
ncbi:MAG: hypothetical protein ABJG41_07250 [Cyclobacteriaceae bacterium]